MASQDEILWEIVQRQVEERIGSILKLLSYTEIQIDIMANLLMDITQVVNEIDSTKITPETQLKIDSLNQILQFSSINFSQIDSSRENYKIPTTVYYKSELRDIQNPYLNLVVPE